MAWYDNAVFYHIYPLGLCGCAKENHGEREEHFDQLRQWALHAAQMECTAIYIGPLFESEGHGYETRDYRKVDGRLGTNEEFADWVKYCHELGLKVIVDGVFNHTGRSFFAFEDIRKNREQSPYLDWYCNVNFWGNTEYNDGFSYENWGGYNLLAKLNLRNPQVKQYHFDTVRFWVEQFDIDGIRLDAADVLDFDFMRELRQVTEGLKQDFFLLGEVIHGDYSRWANQGMLHSVTNYELHKGLYSGHNDHNYFEIAHSIKRLNDICRGTRLYTFVDNHDVARIASKLNNKEHLFNVTLLLYTIWGIPSVYYGSEFSIEGRKEKGSDWNLRPCLRLEDFEHQMINDPVTLLHRELGRLKKEYRELTDGAYRELLLKNRQFAFGRVLDNSAVIVAMNNDDAPARLEIPLPVAASQVTDLLAKAGGELTAEMNGAFEGTNGEPEGMNGASEETNGASQGTNARDEEKEERILDLIGRALDEIRDIDDGFRKMTGHVNAKKPLEEFCLIPSLPERMKHLAELHDEIYQVESQYTGAADAAGTSAGISQGQEGSGCPGTSLEGGRLIVDLPANRGTVFFVS